MVIKVGDYVRLYGEGGMIGLFPSDEFSPEDFVFARNPPEIGVSTLSLS